MDHFVLILFTVAVTTQELAGSDDPISPTWPKGQGTMLKNRAVPADAVLPHITYENVAEAIVWLTNTFGFAEHCPAKRRPSQRRRSYAAGRRASFPPSCVCKEARNCFTA